jgi:electron transfer flavoprotein beta subunit
MPYHSVVIVREVWDTRDLLPSIVSGGALDEKALTRRFEPEDLNALEQALQLKDKHGGKVTVIGLGQPRDVDVLRECLFRGVDEAYRVVPPAGVALDTGAQATLLAAAVKKLGACDLVFCGVSLPEGENSLLGAELAARLGLAQVTYVDSLVEHGGPQVLCKREVEMGSEFIRVSLPAVLVLGVYLLKDDPRTPRAVKAMLKLKLKKTPIPEWTPADLGVADVAALRQVALAGYEPVPVRTVATKDVDPENQAALKAMLQDLL